MIAQNRGPPPGYQNRDQPPAYGAGQQNPNLKQEVKLSNNNKEREIYDNLADLYAIIKTTEHLEKAYVKDSINAKDYEPACTRLIAQFKTAQSLVTESAPDVQKFMQDYKLDCRAAVNRLCVVGIPATLEHGSGGADVSARHIAETVQYFITAMDSLKLNMNSVDSIQPLISDLMESLHKSKMESGSVGKDKIKNWLIVLSKMKASDELDDDQVRQLLFDLEAAYNEFHKSLSS